MPKPSPKIPLPKGWPASAKAFGHGAVQPSRLSRAGRRHADNPHRRLGVTDCEFLWSFGRVRLSCITFGSICSYPQAVRLMEQKIGKTSLISANFDRERSSASDGRIRFPVDLRERIYRHLIETVDEAAPDLNGLCLEDPSTFGGLGPARKPGWCNCVL